MTEEATLQERVRILERTVDVLLDTLNRLLDRETLKLNESEPYVARVGFRDPAVG
mgnify:CR=1 FL=1